MRYILLMLLTILTSCKYYEKEEIKALDNISIDFLKDRYMKGIYRYAYRIPGLDNTFIDTTNLKVYISDTLIPIAQMKQDHEGVFSDSLLTDTYKDIYHSLINSKRFQSLKYLDFDKQKLKLTQPFRQISNNKQDLKTHEVYTRLSYSRICFDTKYQYGIVYLDYSEGNDIGSSGAFRFLLLKKINDKWTIINDYS